MSSSSAAATTTGKIHQGHTQLSSVLFTGSDSPVHTYRRGSRTRGGLKIGRRLRRATRRSPLVAARRAPQGDQLVVEGEAVPASGAP